jgi:uncharacterized secreted repeat protein (TIGR03808 family)
MVSTETIMHRRAFLSAAFGAAALSPTAAAASYTPATLRGSIDANEHGLVPGSGDDQGRLLQKLLVDAAAEDRPLFLPPGRYLVANVTLPSRTRLVGIPGATELVFAGDGHMLSAENAERIELTGLVLDGKGQALADYVPGLVYLAQSQGVAIERCEIRRSSKAGLALDRSAGRIERTIVTGAHDAGIRAIESAGLAIVDNTVTDCGNGGILVWRWNEGDDGTIVTGNRVERIAAKDGGTGENGNGINVFRADGVIVANNRIADCAFTAVRANSASNVQILGNNCRNCGEVGIYSEFAFAGALIANNIVDRAATGISVANFREGGHMAVVGNNIIRNIVDTGPYRPDAPGFGVGISVEADVAASGNIVDGAPLYGMMLGWGPYLRDVAATGNVIRRAPIGIAVSVVEGSGSAVISDNLIAGAERGSVIGMRWADQASGDLARSGAEAFPHLLVERNRIS